MCGGKPTAVADVAPPSGPAGGGVVEAAGAAGQADGPDVVAEGDARAEAHKGDVVVEERVVVQRVGDDRHQGTADLVGVGAGLGLAAQVDCPGGQVTAGVCVGVG